MEETPAHIVIAFGAKRRIIAKPRTYEALIRLAESEFGIERGSTLIAMMDCPWNKFGEVGLHHSAYATVVDGIELRFEKILQAEAEAEAEGRSLTSLSVLCNASNTAPTKEVAIHASKGVTGPTLAGAQIPIPRTLPRVSVATPKLAHPQPIRLSRVLGEDDFPSGDEELFSRPTESRQKAKVEQAGPPSSAPGSTYIGGRINNPVPYTPPNQVIGSPSASTTTHGGGAHVANTGGQQRGPRRGAFPAMPRSTTLGAGFGRSKTFSSFPDHQEAYAGYDSDGMPSMPWAPPAGERRQR